MDNPQIPNSTSSQTFGFLKQLESFFDTNLHKKVPYHLPPHIKELLVKFGPWVILVLMLYALPIILLVLGFASPFPISGLGGYQAGGIYVSREISLHGYFALAVFLIEAAAVPGLFSRKLTGWHLLYYAVLINAIGLLLLGDIVSLIVNVAFSMYFLFEIKPYYN